MNLRLPRDETHRAFLQREDRIVELFIEVGQQVQVRLGKTSANSSKPPFSDGYANPKRTTRLRQPGQKPWGEQPGHRGDTLERVPRRIRPKSTRSDACAQ